MTRLTEALERAHLVPASSPAAAPEDTTADDVLRTWHFDTTENARAMPPPRPTKEPVPATFKGRFPDHALDKLVVGEHADAGLVEQYRRVAPLLHHAQNQRHVRSAMLA